MQYLYSFLTRLVSSLSLLLITGNLFGANYYVSEKKGKDKFDGLTVSKPFKRLQDAANRTKPGDTVFVMNGNYTNDCPACNVLDIVRSGAKNNYIVYTAYSDHHPVINFNGWAGISIRNGVNYIKVNGFEVVGYNRKVNLNKALKQPKSCANKSGTDFDPKYNGNGIVIDGRGKNHTHHIVITNNVVHDCGGGGIGASQSDYITVEGNTVYNTSLYSIFGTSGISFYQFWNSDSARGYHNFIRGNKCYNNRSFVPWIKQCEITDGNGIIIDDFRSRQNGSKLGEYKARTLIENNVCWYNGGTGIHTFQSDHVDIFNNTAYLNSQSPELNAGQILSGLGNDNRIVNNILVSDLTNVINSNYTNTNLVYENNLHFNITEPGREVINVTSRSCVNGMDPAFEHPVNNLKASFRLKKNSPAINCGNIKLYSQTDIEGIRRAQGRSPAIGAYEFTTQ